jgi:hypothetical protein
MWITILAGSTCLVIGATVLGLALGRRPTDDHAVAPVGAEGLSSEETASHLACSMAVAYLTSAVMEIERDDFERARSRLDRAEEELVNAKSSAEDDDTRELITPVIVKVREVRNTLPASGPDALPQLRVLAGAVRALAARPTPVNSLRRL